MWSTMAVHRDDPYFSPPNNVFSFSLAFFAELVRNLLRLSCPPPAPHPETTLRLPLCVVGTL